MRRRDNQDREEPSNGSNTWDRKNYDFSRLFRSIAGPTRRNRLDTWGEESSCRSSLAKLGNIVIDYPMHIVSLVWALLYMTGFFRHLGKQKNIAKGGEGYGINVDVMGTSIALETFACMVILVLSVSTLGKRLRGPKLPDYSPFAHYLIQLENDETFSEEDRRIITRPNLEDPEECQQCVNFHQEFIDWLANGVDRSMDGEWDVVGNWEVIGLVTQAIAVRFPFQFSEAPCVGEAVAAAGGVLGADDLHELPRRRRARQLSQASFREGGGAGYEAEFPAANHSLLAAVASEADQGQQGDRMLSPGGGNVDLYQTQLLGSTIADRDVAQADVQQHGQSDGFEEASSEEREAAWNASWKKMQVVPRSKPINPQDIAMRVLSRVTTVRCRRQGITQPDERPARQASILKGLLDVFLKNVVCDDPQALAGCSFALLNLLRPAISDGQWSNWRYWYSYDPSATGAFKKLSPRQQAWMMHILMNGNDHAELIALSILRGLHFQETTKFLEQYIKIFYRNSAGEAKDKARKVIVGLFRHIENPLYKRTKGDYESRWIAEVLTLMTEVPLPHDVSLSSSRRVARDREAVVPEELSGAGHDPQRYYTKSSQGNPFEDLGIKRSEVVDLLMPLINDTAEWIVVGGQRSRFTAGQYLAEEVKCLLLSLEETETLPKDLENGITLAREQRQETEGAEERLNEYCQHRKTLACYAEYLGYNLSPGMRAAALLRFAKDMGSEVVVFVSDSDRVIKEQDRLRPINPSSKIYRVYAADDFTWREIQTEREHRFAGRLVPATELTLRSSAADAPAHPWVLSAQSIFWSLAKSVQLEEFNRMQRGDTEGWVGNEESTSALFASGSDNIEAIKNGILCSQHTPHMTPLMCLLRAEKQRDAYRILAALLSDPQDGDALQKIFGQLVRSPDNAGQWLDPENYEYSAGDFRDCSPIAKARYVAELVFAAKSDIEKVRALLDCFYAQSPSVATQFFNIQGACTSQDQWKERRNLFGKTISALTESRDFNDCQRDIIGGVLDENLSQGEHIAWGDQLIVYVQMTINRPSGDEVFDQLILTAIQTLEGNVPSAARERLALLMLTALDLAQLSQDNDDNPQRFEQKKYAKMFDVLTAMTKGFYRAEILASDNPLAKENAPDFRALRQALEALRSPLETGAYERFYIRMAIYYLHQKKHVDEGQWPLCEERAYGLLSHVVNNSACCNDISYYDRKHLITILSYLTDSRVYRSEDSPYVISYKAIVYRILYILFSTMTFEVLEMNVEITKDERVSKHLLLTEDSTLHGFFVMCVGAAANSSFSTGVAALIEGIQGSEFLGQLSEASKEDGLKKVIDRMTALALYAVQNQHKDNTAQGKIELLAVLNAVNDIGHWSGFDPNRRRSLEDFFCDGGDMHTAFCDLGIAPEAMSTILRTLKRSDNNRWLFSQNPSYRDDEQSFLLEGGHQIN